MTEGKTCSIKTMKAINKIISKLDMRKVGNYAILDDGRYLIVRVPDDVPGVWIEDEEGDEYYIELEKIKSYE